MNDKLVTESIVQEITNTINNTSIIQQIKTEVLNEINQVLLSKQSIVEYQSLIPNDGPIIWNNELISYTINNNNIVITNDCIIGFYNKSMMKYDIIKIKAGSYLLNGTVGNNTDLIILDINNNNYSFRLQSSFSTLTTNNTFIIGMRGIPLLTKYLQQLNKVKHLVNLNTIFTINGNVLNFVYDTNTSLNISNIISNKNLYYIIPISKKITINTTTSITGGTANSSNVIITENVATTNELSLIEPLTFNMTSNANTITIIVNKYINLINIDELINPEYFYKYIVLKQKS